MAATNAVQFDQPDRTVLPLALTCVLLSPLIAGFCAWKVTIPPATSRLLRRCNDRPGRRSDGTLVTHRLAGVSESAASRCVGTRTAEHPAALHRRGADGDAG